jgi:hypothetical protein
VLRKLKQSHADMFDGCGLDQLQRGIAAMRKDNANTNAGQQHLEGQQQLMPEYVQQAPALALAPAPAPALVPSAAVPPAPAPAPPPASASSHEHAGTTTGHQPAAAAHEGPAATDTNYHHQICWQRKNSLFHQAEQFSNDYAEYQVFLAVLGVGGKMWVAGGGPDLDHEHNFNQVVKSVGEHFERFRKERAEGRAPMRPAARPVDRFKPKGWYCRKGGAFAKFMKLEKATIKAHMLQQCQPQVKGQYAKCASAMWETMEAGQKRRYANEDVDQDEEVEDEQDVDQDEVAEDEEQQEGVGHQVRKWATFP